MRAGRPEVVGRRAFAYCRVSTQEQARDEHYSPANQEARCRDYTKHKSWRLVKVLRDVGSGESAEREEYQELLAAIRDGLVDVVVTYRLDRLSRNVADVYDALDLFREKGVGFVSVQEAFDTTTALGRAMLGVAAVFAQLTREMISENTKDGLDLPPTVVPLPVSVRSLVSWSVFSIRRACSEPCCWPSRAPYPSLPESTRSGGC